MSALTAPTVFLAPRHPFLKASMCPKYAEDFPRKHQTAQQRRKPGCLGLEFRSLLAQSASKCFKGC